MSRNSAQFGKLIKSFLKRNNYTLRKVADMSGISTTYWNNMSNGRVPSPELIDKIADIFDELNRNELKIAAGYIPDNADMDAATAVAIALCPNSKIPQEGIDQILEFVKEIEQCYDKS